MRIYRKSSIEVVFELLGIMLGLNQYQQTQKVVFLSPECREACRKLEQYSKQVRLVSVEKFQSVEDVEEYIKTKDTELKQVMGYRNKLRNKLRNAKEPEVIKQLKSDRNDCTSIIKQLRKEKQIARTVIEDQEKIVRLMECEVNCQRENGPYKLIDAVGKVERTKGSRER